MNLNGKLPLLAAVSFCLVLINFSCSKSSGGGTTPDPDPCSGVSLSVSATTDNSGSCDNSGKISATGSGTGTLSFSIDGTNFQASGDFTKLAKGNYTVTVKNAAGCKATKAVTIGETTEVAGPNFTAVKALIQANCVSCHNPTGVQPNPNWTVDCNIVNQSASIKTRAVDLGTMPPTGPLSQANKDIISNWIAAGGKISN
jgi:mono/diheme cytochrome c family protein